MINRTRLRRASWSLVVSGLAVTGIGELGTVAAVNAAEHPVPPTLLDSTTRSVDVSAPSAALASLAAASDSSGATFVVDVTHDNADNQLLDDQCITTAGGCSLRAAIQQANATAGPNRIEFDIAGSGPHTITITDRINISDLTGPLVIDGYTQPGAAENTDPVASNATIQIGIEGDDYIGGRPALAISSPDNIIRGLAIYNAYHPILIAGDDADRNQIVGNFIGTNPEATFYIPWGWSNAAGVQMDIGASENLIGTPAIADRNVISGGKSWGLRIEQNETHSNKVQNNIIGLNPSGTDRLPQQGGIDIQWGARDNLIGGRGEREHNVFSGLVYSAIDFSHESFNNQAIGNYIGTDLTGKLSYDWTRNRFGLLVKDDARLNYYEANVVVNQTSEGVYNKHNYTGANTFVNNLIGISLDGSAYGNGREGVQLRGHDDIFERNIIANNNYDGFYLDSNNDSGPNDDEITERNRLSANAFWNNGQDGVDISGSGTQGDLSAPTITSAASGTVSGTACASCEVEVYLADASASEAQGRQYLGTVLADATSGDFTFADSRIELGRPITTLAIDTLNNTSEFSSRVDVSANAGDVHELVNSGSGKCLEIQDGSTADGANIHQATCDDNPAQQWERVPAAVGFALRNPISDKCLDVAAASTDQGANVELRTCDGTTNQTLTQQGQAMQFAHSNRCLDVNGGSNADGANIQQWSCNGTAAQSFTDGAPLVGPQPIVTTPGDLTFLRNAVASTTVAATPAGVTFTALRLPDGLTIDPDTGIVTGTPSRVGRFPVTILVHNADGLDAVDAMWTVDYEPLPPTIEAIADQLDNIGTDVSLQVVASDLNGDALIFSASGLPTGLDIDAASGLITGTMTEGGDFTVVVTVTDGTTPVDESFTWTVDPGFVCDVTGDTLTWTDQGANTYYIRHIVGTEDNYLGSVTGALDYTVPSQFGQYKVTAFTPNRIETFCDAPLGDGDGDDG